MPRRYRFSGLLRGTDYNFCFLCPAFTFFWGIGSYFCFLCPASTFSRFIMGSKAFDPDITKILIICKFPVDTFLTFVLYCCKPMKRKLGCQTVVSESGMV